LSEILRLAYRWRLEACGRTATAWFCNIPAGEMSYRIAPA
jgi:hypothetical protein